MVYHGTWNRVWVVLNPRNPRSNVVRIECLAALTDQLLRSCLVHPLEDGIKHVLDFNASRKRPHLDTNAAKGAFGVNVKWRNRPLRATMLDIPLGGKRTNRLDKVAGNRDRDW